MKPLIVVNFKAYESATGDNAVKLAKYAEEVSRDEKVPVIIAVQATDITKVSQATDLDVYAQHAEITGFGAHTGAVLIEAVKAAGAKGILINHSEKTLELKIIEKTIMR